MLDSEDIINGMRAIPWIITIEGTFTYFNLWYGFKKGIDAFDKQKELSNLVQTSPLFKEIVQKVLIALTYTDFEMAWRYIPTKDRPKNKASILKLAAKVYDRDEHNAHVGYFLAMLNKEFNEVTEYIKTLNLDLIPQTLTEIKLRQKESVFLRSIMAWLNLKMIGENLKAHELFNNPSKEIFEKMCGSIYFGFNEYRTISKCYTN